MSSDVTTVWWEGVETPPPPLAPLPKDLDALWLRVAGWCKQAWCSRRALLRAAKEVHARMPALRQATEPEFDRHLATVREILGRGHPAAVDLHVAFAAVAEACRRSLKLTPHQVQIAAAMGLYHQRCVEMATGEGKTLVAAMAAIVCAWRGRGVHVLTANDYLAARDREWAVPLFDRCGIETCSIVQDTAPAERVDAYRAPIVYSTQQQIAADVLRHQVGALPICPPRLWAIVDEADSLLVDEAATPLILSADSGDQKRAQAILDAAAAAAAMVVGRDYILDEQHRDVRLAGPGKAMLRQLARSQGGLWVSQRAGEELIQQALTAKHFFIRDREYVIQEEEPEAAVADGSPASSSPERKIVIVDAATGRPMPDRSWREGLHQAVEAKEGLPPSPLKITSARLSFQSFFRSYQRMSAMSGTIWEVRGELFRVYGMLSVRIPRHRKNLRRDRCWQWAPSAEAKLTRVISAIRAAHAAGRPVLVGVQSVATSEAISRRIADLPHHVLNARLHAQEAEIVARAGQPGAVTIATNMAGRGTDIKLGPGVAALGGLLVLAAEPNFSKRVDRQLFGRAGRQGDPGDAYAFCCPQDELFVRHAPKSPRVIGRMRLGFLAPLFVALAQWQAERQSAKARGQVVKQDEQWQETLGFAGV